MGGPLSGIQVLDFSEGAQGPYAAALLADMGAEVIKVERPGRGDLMRESPPFKNGVSLCCVTINRGKKSVILDLKNPDDIGKALSIAGVATSCWRTGGRAWPTGLALVTTRSSQSTHESFTPRPQDSAALVLIAASPAWILSRKQFLV
jgi:CoA transferase family III